MIATRTNHNQGAMVSAPRPPAARRPKQFVADGMPAWVGFLNVHSKLVRRLDAQLSASHGMTLNEYEVLLKLELAGGTLRMSELAAAALLSRSGLTRIVDELETQQLVVREPDLQDGRVLLATLTRRGRARFNAAARAHVADVHTLFLDPLTPQQRQALAGAWARIEAALPETADEPPAVSARRTRRRTSPIA